MSIKLIATDLDGTLLSGDHMTITDRTISALKKAHDMGVKIAIATGRTMVLIKSIIEQIPFVDYIIYANGACVYDMKSSKLLYKDLIPNEIAKDIIPYFLEKNVFFEVYIDGRSNSQIELKKYFRGEAFPDDFVERVIKDMDFHTSLVDFIGDKDIEKVTFYSLKDEDYDELVKKLEEHNLAVAISFKGSLEGTKKTATKGKALENLCKILDIKPSEAMAFGDAGNDADMLKFAEYSFAMKNGDDESKASAKYVADSNEEDGLAKIVEKFVINC